MEEGHATSLSLTAMPLNLVRMYLHDFSYIGVSKDDFFCVSMNLFVMQTDDQAS